MTIEYWKNKRVFITGHSGFKGAWLAMILHHLGAKIKGFSLPPPTEPSMYDICRIQKLLESEFNDIRDQRLIQESILGFEPEVLFHLAAQPLVRYSYLHPLETLETNILGTAHVLEACRKAGSLKAVVVVTTDKCYENKEWHWGYRENEALGGHDPYSASKACAELITASWRNSYFASDKACQPNIATARAGNVIGGGDWSPDRLLPDILSRFIDSEPAQLRNPGAIRPWQHVLEPLYGYLVLAQMLDEQGVDYAGAWNFGPYDINAIPVSRIADHLSEKWGNGANWTVDSSSQPHEANFLKLDSSKAIQQLKWKPVWNIEKSLDLVVDWHKAWLSESDMLEFSLGQFETYIDCISSL